MKRVKFKWRNVVAMAICLTATTMFTGCDPEDDPDNGTNNPGAVTDFTATAGDGQVTLTWDEPYDNGGSEITGYEVTMDAWASKVTKTASELSHTYTGLANGTEYTFKVRAVNAGGAGAESEAKATPTETGGGGTSGTFAFKDKTRREWLQALESFNIKLFYPEENNSGMSGYAVRILKKNDYIYWYNSIDGQFLWKSEANGGLYEYLCDIGETDADYRFYQVRKVTAAEMSSPLEERPIMRLSQVSAEFQQALENKGNASGLNRVIKGIRGTKTGTGVIAGQDVDIYEEDNFIRYYVIPENGFCLKVETKNLQTGVWSLYFEVTEYSTTSFPAFDTEEQIFNVMDTKGVSFSLEYGYGIGVVRLGYNMGAPLNEPENVEMWPTEYLNRFCDMEPCGRIPAYTGGGNTFQSNIQFNWDAGYNTNVIMFNVPQADCDAYASQLQSTGWIYSSPLSGKQIFNASNVAPGDNATKGMSIIIEYNDGQMRVGFSKVNERRKPWITYL